MPRKMSNLNINEALVTVNKSNFAGSIDLYYQNIECYGCPLTKLTTLNEDLQEIVLDTRYSLQLNFRRANSPPDRSESICHFDRFDLNSHGHYKIDISANASEANATKAINCELTVLNGGECLLCPFAILLCFLFAVTIMDRLYEWAKARKQSKIGDQTGVFAEPESQPELAARTSTSTEKPDLPDVARGGESGSLGETAKNDVSHAVYVSDSPKDGSKAEVNRKRKRLDALDAFRGLTITGMIMVNYGGASYMFLEHKPWDGLTLADFVFPFFIFSMGASIALSMKSMLWRHDFNQVIFKILRRSIILMALGLSLNSMSLNGRSLYYLRLPGVLQRFSISYLVVALAYALELYSKRYLTRSMTSGTSSRLTLSSKITGTFFELVTAISCLSAYVYVTYFLEYSTECPAGYVGPGGSTDGGQVANCTGGAAAWMDNTLLGSSHLYNDTELKHIFGSNIPHDPEGLLGYTTSILLTLAGLQCGKILSRRQSNHRARIIGMIQWMIVMALLSVAVVANPINKKLWSFTFVSVTGAIAYLVLLSFYILLDVYNCQRVYILRLLLSAGKNAIFLYVGHSLVHKMLPWYFAVADETSHLQLMMRLSWSTYVWLLIADYMAAKSLFIKI